MSSRRVMLAEITQHPIQEGVVQLSRNVLGEADGVGISGGAYRS